MVGIGYSSNLWVIENGRPFIEADAMLFEIADCLVIVPFESGFSTVLAFPNYTARQFMNAQESKERTTVRPDLLFYSKSRKVYSLVVKLILFPFSFTGSSTW
jgi:hypothetical protein